MILLLALGCGPEPTLIDGQVNGESLNEPLTAFWGGPFVLFTDKSLSCFEVDWVRRTYDAAEAPTDFDFVGLQFSFDNTEPVAGTFSVEGTNAAVSAKALVVTGGAFVEARGRTGNLVVDGGFEEDDWMFGSFDVDFGVDSDDNPKGSYSSSAFGTVYCNNLVRN